MNDQKARSLAPAVRAEFHPAAGKVIRGPVGEIHRAQRPGHRLAIGLSRRLECGLEDPHVAVGRDEVLGRPRLVGLLLEILDHALLRSGSPVGDHRHDALELVNVHVAAQVRIQNRRPVRDRRNFPVPEAELVHFLHQQFRIRDGRGKKKQDVRALRANTLDQRRGVRKRWRECLIDNQREAEPGKLVLLDRLHERY